MKKKSNILTNQIKQTKKKALRNKMKNGKNLDNNYWNILQRDIKEDIKKINK